MAFRGFISPCIVSGDGLAHWVDTAIPFLLPSSFSHGIEPRGGLNLPDPLCLPLFC